MGVIDRKKWKKWKNRALSEQERDVIEIECLSDGLRDERHTKKICSHGWKMSCKWPADGVMLRWGGETVRGRAGVKDCCVNLCKASFTSNDSKVNYQNVYLNKL